MYNNDESNIVITYDILNECIRLKQRNKELEDKNKLLYKLYKYHIENNYDLLNKISGLYKYISDLNSDFSDLENEYLTYKNKLVNEIVNKYNYKFESSDDYD